MRYGVATTSAEEIVAALEFARRTVTTRRESLVAAAQQEGIAPDRLAAEAHDLIRAQTTLGCWEQVEKLQQRFPTAPPKVALRYAYEYQLRQLLSRGADDGWSGRENDARRVAADAVRKWLDDFCDPGMTLASEALDDYKPLDG